MFLKKKVKIIHKNAFSIVPIEIQVQIKKLQTHFFEAPSLR